MTPEELDEIISVLSELVDWDAYVFHSDAACWQRARRLHERFMDERDRLRKGDEA